MKKFLALLFVSAVVVSCKPADNRTSSPTGPVTTIGGLTVPDKKNFSAAEMIIGKRICKSFEYKREKMAKLTDMAEKFSFTGQWKACGEAAVTLAQYGVSISNTTSDLRYVPDLTSTKSFTDVLTDETEPMKTLCTNLEASTVVSNFVALGASNYLLKIYTLSGYDTYEISRMSKNGSGAYALVSTQIVSVITETSPNYELRLAGIERTRILNSTCTGSKDYTSLGHTFVAATTAYKLPTE